MTDAAGLCDGSEKKWESSTGRYQITKIHLIPFVQQRIRKYRKQQQPAMFIYFTISFVICKNVSWVSMLRRALSVLWGELTKGETKHRREIKDSKILKQKLT